MSAALERLDTDDATALLECQSDVLVLMSGNAPLPAALDCITSGLERLIPDSVCSVLLLADGSLRHGSAPSLPEAYLAAIDGLVPGPGAGSCGSAAYLGRPVVVADIASDPRWDEFRAVAVAAGLRACWSSPIVGTSAAVVGTFAVYHRHPHRPTAREQAIVDRLTYLASVVIDHAATIGALVLSEERFRRAFEDNAVAMAVLDTSGRVQRVNEEFSRLVGGLPERFADVVPREERAPLDQHLATVCAGRSRSEQVEVRLAAGPAVSITFSLVRGAQGEPVQISVTMLDITERIAAQHERRARQEAELARRTADSASRAKSAFLSAVSHEMRTPLQAITGFAELLATLDLDLARRREALGHITAGATHLLELVDDTLDLARIEAGALPVDLVEVALAPLLGEVVDFLAPVASGHDVTLALGRVSGEVRADRRRLRQVLINLVSNGIRYSGPRRTVRVAAAAGRVTVTDDGPGIPAALRARLFEPFLAHPSTGGEGIGLGLMLARGLAEAMGGRLTLDDAPGGGTVAAVSLPAARS